MTEANQAHETQEVEIPAIVFIGKNPIDGQMVLDVRIPDDANPLEVLGALEVVKASIIAETGAIRGADATQAIADAISKGLAEGK